MCVAAEWVRCEWVRCEVDIMNKCANERRDSPRM